MTDPGTDNAEINNDPAPIHAARGDAEVIHTEAPPLVSRPRPTPTGLPRRDRKAWRALEQERFQRETVAAATAGRERKPEARQAFASDPPRGLGRRGRRAWRAIEREQTRRWWKQHRASTNDVDARAAGVLVIALLLGVAMLWGILISRSQNIDTGSRSRTSLAPVPAELPVIEASSTIASNTVDASAEPSKPALIGSSSVNSPTVAAPLAGHWQPAPGGGVTPIPPVTATVATDTVAEQALSVLPIVDADLATPVAAVTAWLTRTCPSNWTDPYGDNLRRGHATMTTAGWTEDDPASDAPGHTIWTKVVVPGHQTRRCGDFSVHLSTDAPTTHGTAFVGYTANRLVTAPGAPSTVEHLIGARIVVRQSDGRWLVDHAVVGG